MKIRSNPFVFLGLALIFISLFIFTFTFFPVIKAELIFLIKTPRTDVVITTQTKTKEKNTIVVKDPNFGIVIPKIGANASVVSNVDPLNSKVYQKALTKGVAHAAGSAFPGEDGNIFIFSHSSVNFYEAARYNSIFYLLSKLKEGDKIHLYFKNKEYVYTVKDKFLAAPNEVEYLKKGNTPTLTLMTCWPPGTTLKRLLVIGEPAI